MPLCKAFIKAVLHKYISNGLMFFSCNFPVSDLISKLSTCVETEGGQTAVLIDNPQGCKHA
jgi:hypothetical protein